MSTSAISSALSGLRTAQKALDVTASNIANAGVEGYTKKSVSQEAVVSGGVGVGVRFGEVQRFVDKAVQRDYRTQLGSQSFLTTKESFLARVMALHGASDQETNISAHLNKLYEGFVSLSASPDSASIQSSIVAQASAVAKTFNNLSKNLLAMRNEAQAQLQGEVSDLNASLQQIADLNKRIQSLTNIGQSTAAVEDQRDMLVKSVSQQLNITYYVDGNGVTVVQTRDGQVLADTEARPLSIKSENVTFSSLYPDSLGGIVLLADQTGAAYDIASTGPGGRIGALLDVRDKEITDYMTQLDELAHKMMMRFDDQGLRLFTDPAGAIPVNSPNQYVGLAYGMKVNDNIVNDTSLLQKGTSGPAINAGSNEVVMKIVNYAFGKFKDAAGTPNVAFNTQALGANGKLSFNITSDPNASILQFSNAMLDKQASDYNMSKTTLDNEKKYTQEIESRLLSGSAVNTDEEMGRMIELQKSYSANAKMIAALDELFRDLLNAI